MRYNDEERESGEGRAPVDRKPDAFTRKPSRQPPGRPEQNRERGYLSYNAVNTRRMTTGLGRKVLRNQRESSVGAAKRQPLVQGCRHLSAARPHILRQQWRRHWRFRRPYTTA